jgi:hypothetical protein
MSHGGFMKILNVGPLNILAKPTVCILAVAATMTLSSCGGGGLSSVATGAITDDSGAIASVTGVPDLGAGASLHGKQVFPTNNAWNTAIDTAAVDPNSNTLIASIGAATRIHPDFGSDPSYGIPYVVVSGTQAKVPVSFYYPTESDKGPYPLPANAPIEGGSDGHVLVIDRDNWRLYEMFDANRPAGGKGWTAGAGAIWDLKTNATRPAGWTSADAAGLPIFPGLVRRDEVAAGVIKHAIRFTCVHTRHAYTAPASHFASSLTGAQYPPMGMRVRLKASVNISAYPAGAKVVLTAMKKYGMILADNGSNWYFQGMTDTHWNDNDMNTLKQLKGSDFEVVKMGAIVTK